MQTFNSRFGLVQAGKIESFRKGKTLTVGGKKIKPTASFWSRFNPMRQTVIPAPQAAEGEDQQSDEIRQDIDFTLGYYVLLEGGHDRYVGAEEFGAFEPVK